MQLYWIWVIILTGRVFHAKHFPYFLVYILWCSLLFCLIFQGGIWQSLHLDDLREEKHSMPPVQMLIQHTVSSLIGSALNKQAQDGEDEDNQEIRPSCNLDLDHLIKLCIHGAAGMVRNECDLRGSATLIRDMLDLFASEEGNQRY